MYCEYGDLDNYDGNESYAFESWEEDYTPPVGEGWAVTGMICGIVSAVLMFLMFCCSSFLASLITLPIAIVGLVASIIGLRKGQNKGMCTTGIVCSAIVAAIAVLVLFWQLLLFLITGALSLMDY